MENKERNGSADGEYIKKRTLESMLTFCDELHSALSWMDKLEALLESPEIEYNSKIHKGILLECRWIPYCFY